MSLSRVDPVWPSNGRAMVSGWFTSRVTKYHGAVELPRDHKVQEESYSAPQAVLMRRGRGQLKRAPLSRSHL